MPAPANKRWRGPKLEELKKLWFEDGLTGQEIADKLNISRNAVLGAIHRLRHSLNAQGATKMVRRVRPAQRPKKAPVPAPVVKRAPPPRPAFRVVTVKELEHLAPQLNSILEVKPWLCSYPYGEKDHKFCGRPRVHGAYCVDHGRLCYVPPQPRRR